MISTTCGAGTTINYFTTNGRSIEIHTNSNCNLTYENKKINSIQIGSTTYSIGDYFNHDYTKIPSKYYIKSIQEGGSKSKFRYKYTFFSHFLNKSSTYILPCLGKNMNYFYTDRYFINAYVSEDYKSLYLMYRFSKSDDYFENVENNILKHRDFKECIKTIENGFDVFKFDIPREHISDIKVFFDGKYSRLSDDLKHNIKTFYYLSDKSHTMQVLNRGKELKERLEAWLACDFTGIDLDEKPKKKDEIWELY